MAGRAVHFALTESDVERIRAVSETDRFDFVTDTVETAWFDDHPEWLAQSDKAWDAIHRVLADGHLHWTGGDYPLNHVVLGGEFLCDADDGVLLLKTPEQVRDASTALARLSEAEFARRYWSIPADDYESVLDDEDLGYAWAWFAPVRDLFARAAAVGRAVLFTVGL